MSHTKRGKKSGKGQKRTNKTNKRNSSNKKRPVKRLVDIGVSRARITGQPGMNQNLAVSNALAKTMSQNRNMAQGLAQSQALGMGQSLA
jgi:hypothetical protein